MSIKQNLTNPEPWAGLAMGNEAVARAMIEVSTRVITTYPGSPVPEIATTLNLIAPEHRDFYFESSTNEKVALEVATGGSLNGHLSTVFFKSVGLNVASDSLIQLSMLELIGGLVVILGDDPGANSSQNEQDNRIWARMSYIPMLEPGSPTEAYQMYKEAAALAKRQRGPVFLRLTTHVCHAREVVQFAAMSGEEPDWTPRFDANNGPYWPIAAAVFPLKRKALQKLQAYEALAEESPLNRVLAPHGVAPVDSKRLGVISAGIPAYSVLENIDQAGATVDLLKLGITYPLPSQKILAFLEAHDEVVILEELERVLEGEIKALAYDNSVKCRILARPDWDQVMGEFDPVRSYKLLAGFWPKAFEPRDFPEPSAEVVPRPPQLCPGCGHRSAFHAVKKAIESDTITVADIGCHSLGSLPPYNMGEVLLCMGHSVSTGAGLAVKNDTRKVVSFLGDSTMFHAALPGIINAIIYNHNVTLVLLDNGTTAMTGHQARHGSGEIGDKIPIIGLLETLGVQKILDVDSYNQRKLIAYVQEANAHEGFAVVIARHPCMLKFTRASRKKSPGLKLPKIAVNPEQAADALPAMEQFGCPTFQRTEDDQVGVSEDLCIGCGSCIMSAAPGTLKIQRPLAPAPASAPSPDGAKSPGAKSPGGVK